MNKVLLNTNLTFGGIIEVDKCLKVPILLRYIDPLNWWLTNNDVFSRLFVIVLQRFCISATFVPSEQIFSKVSQILVEKYKRLSGKKL